MGGAFKMSIGKGGEWGFKLGNSGRGGAFRKLTGRRGKALGLSIGN